MLKFLNFKQKKANKIFKKAQELMNNYKDANAIILFKKVIKLDPNNSSSYYNIGLIYKYRLEWNKSLDYNLKAYKLNPEDEAARWNTAIAATALGKWDIARKAWKDQCFDLGEEHGEINSNFGQTPVRLNSENGEVVWGTRIDPVRVKINNIPFEDSGYHYE